MRRAVAVTVVAACALVVLGAGSAGAHARLVRSQPAGGQALGADRVVTLTFDDPVDVGGSSLSVTTALVDPFVVHFDKAHLETSPGQQVEQALNVDQYAKTHTVLVEDMLAPSSDVVTGSGSC